MRRPVADFQRWTQRLARTQVCVASCAGRKERIRYRISSGRAPMRSPPAALA
uniref:Uncharacterized protein n=1 Tax=Setaria italica TaxID=4555 RepID=K3ZNJ2_SETIT